MLSLLKKAVILSLTLGDFQCGLIVKLVLSAAQVVAESAKPYTIDEDFSYLMKSNE